jgi:hypothetical protein
MNIIPSFFIYKICYKVFNLKSLTFNFVRDNGIPPRYNLLLILHYK